MACKYETGRINSTRHGLTAQIGLGIPVVVKQPQHAALDRHEKPHPDIEYGWRDFPLIVEAAENEALWRQPDLRPRRRTLGNHAFPVVDPITIGQMNDAFRVVGLLVEREDDGVRKDVVDELRSHRAGKSVVVDLNRGRPMCQDTRARPLRVAIEVDGDLDPPVAEQVCDRFVCHRAGVDKLIERRCQPPAYLAAVIRTEGYAEHLEPGAVMSLK